jgi:hypothetical protein
MFSKDMVVTLLKQNSNFFHWRYVATEYSRWQDNILKENKDTKVSRQNKDVFEWALSFQTHMYTSSSPHMYKSQNI